MLLICLGIAVFTVLAEATAPAITANSTEPVMTTCASEKNVFATVKRCSCVLAVCRIVKQQCTRRYRNNNNLNEHNNA
jgi:hypothetical protein